MMKNRDYTIAEKDLMEEERIQKKIFDNIDNKKSFVFDAVAGSGKTYALVETLKYIIKSNHKELKDLNRNVLVVTFTNAAKDEIINRIGTHPSLNIGTIHDLMWDFVKIHQEELIEIHKEEINLNIKDLSEELGADLGAFKSYLKLLGFPDKMAEYYKMSTNKLRSHLDAFEEVDKTHYSNISKFRNKINKTRRLTLLSNIDYSKHKEVIYDTTLVKDSLHTFRISHDTVIKYISKIIKDHVLLQNALISKYPYILVDEYQDTNVLIYDVLKKIALNKQVVIGLFGDKMQAIYEKNINYSEQTFEKIIKNYNRRSSNKVIFVASKISGRDEKTIYSNNLEGDIRYYNGNDVFAVIDELENDWNIKDDNALQCLFLKNKDIVKQLGFGNFYEIFEKSSQYKGSNWELLNPETLSSNPKDLGYIQTIIYKMVDIYKLLSKEHLFLKGINIHVNKREITQKDYSDLKTIIQNLDASLLGINKEELTLKKFTDEIISEDFIINPLLKRYYYANFNFDKDIIDGFNLRSEQIETIIREFMNQYESESDEGNFDINHLLNLPMEEVVLWYNFINKTNKDSTMFDTWHNSKVKNIVMF